MAKKRKKTVRDKMDARDRALEKAGGKTKKKKARNYSGYLTPKQMTKSALDEAGMISPKKKKKKKRRLTKGGLLTAGLDALKGVKIE